ncbi:synergin gamma-like [Prorops nasuta]|uniref:synergin gamma-like n=1 Tax=Prorops nasuta TaxID=863751 RepID=UPI0034CD9695
MLKMNKDHMEKRQTQVPVWLWANSPNLPLLYKAVWEAVKEDKAKAIRNELLVDTNKIFPLLLTSQLSTEVLGHIWSLANQKYAGQLTEQELYIVLALVGAAQASYAFNNLDVLHLFSAAPVPYLDVKYILSLQSRILVNPSNNAETGMAEPKSTRTELSSSDATDDFADFQSAPLSNIYSSSIRDSKQGSAIGSRLANHNLAVKKPVEKQKKSIASNATLSMRLTNLPINLSSQTIRDRNSTMTPHCMPELFPKCTVKGQSKTVILKDTVIRNDTSNEHVVDRREISSGSSVSVDITETHNNSVAFKKLESTFQVEPQKVKTMHPQDDLMNLQLVEDKYSALRELVPEVTSSPLMEQSTNDDEMRNFTDDFGEFVSAERTKLPPVPCNILEIDHDNVSLGINVKLHESETKDLQFDILESFDNFKISHLADEKSRLEERFELAVDTSREINKLGKNIARDDVPPFSLNEPYNSSGSLIRSSSVSSLDLKSFLSPNTEEETMTEVNHMRVFTEWKRYMESCVLLLQIAANIFGGINSEIVLSQVLNSARGYSFLCDLAEVAAICRRINFSYKEMNINIHGFDELLVDINKIWTEMGPFYANIPIVTELPVWPLQKEEVITCSLCLTIITSGSIVHNENSYHAACANLWLNCIDGSLPVLKHAIASGIGNDHS